MRRRKRRQRRGSAVLMILACCTICFLCGFTFRGSVTTAYADSDVTTASYDAIAAAQIDETIVDVDNAEAAPEEVAVDTGDVSGDEVPAEKLYTSIVVERGDTLYSIAEEYYSGQWGSVKKYVEEIMRVNGLTHDYITQGNYLVIPYYI